MSSSRNPRETQRADRTWIHDRGGPSAPHPLASTPPSPTAAAGKVLNETAIESACKTLGGIYSPTCNGDYIRNTLRLVVAGALVRGALSQAGDSKLKGRLRRESDFKANLESDGKKQELVDLLRSMAKKQVLWRNLFENGTLLSSF